MSNLIDLSGKRFGNLLVIERAKNIGNQTAWKCKCDCNKITIVTGANLRTHHTTSCGCYQKEVARKAQSKTNTFVINGDTAIVYSSKGDEFYIDVGDIDKVKKHYWSISCGYVHTNINKHHIQLQRYLMDNPYGKVVDHKDGNPLNNRRNNLRICSQAENNRNICKKKPETSNYTGVDWCEKLSKWRARITLNYRSIHLGYFKNIEDAKKARREAEDKYFGEYAYSNSR